MEVAGVASQWQTAVAGTGGTTSLLRSAESSLRGRALVPESKLVVRKCSRVAGHLLVQAMAGKKKVSVYDAGWSKQWFGAGIFAENTEVEDVNIVKKLEKKKLLSQVEKAGLLSKVESVGLSLSQIEKLGLLSKAEDLGLLTLAENFATASPAVLASLSLPLFVAALLVLILIPDSDPILLVAQNVLAALFLAGGVGLFVGSIVLTGLQEE